MSDKIQLEIVTPRGRALLAEVDEVTAPSVDGEFGVLPGHLPVLAALRTGIVTYRQGAESTRCAVGPGFAEAGPDKLVILTDEYAERAHIDPVVLRKELGDIQQELAKLESFAIVSVEALGGAPSEVDARIPREMWIGKENWLATQLDLLRRPAAGHPAPVRGLRGRPPSRRGRGPGGDRGVTARHAARRVDAGRPRSRRRRRVARGPQLPAAEGDRPRSGRARGRRRPRRRRIAGREPPRGRASPARQRRGSSSPTWPSPGGAPTGARARSWRTALRCPRCRSTLRARCTSASSSSRTPARSRARAAAGRRRGPRATRSPSPTGSAPPPTRTFTPPSSRATPARRTGRGPRPPGDPRAGALSTCCSRCGPVRISQDRSTPRASGYWIVKRLD